jgi:hypothetical protein
MKRRRKRKKNTTSGKGSDVRGARVECWYGCGREAEMVYASTEKDKTKWLCRECYHRYIGRRKYMNGY